MGRALRTIELLAMGGGLAARASWPRDTSGHMCVLVVMEKRWFGCAEMMCESIMIRNQRCIDEMK